MSEDPIVLVVGIVVGGGILAVIVYYIMRFMRGSIQLSLPSTAFNPHDTITGSFDLHAKKAIEGNQLIVSLIGTEVTRKRRNGKTHTSSREIYRDEVLVEGGRLYEAGFMGTYNFNISTPNMQSSEFMNSTAGQLLTTAARMFGNRSTRLKWRVEARLDAKGVDLATSRSVSIHMQQGFL